MTTTSPHADLLTRYRQAQDAMGGCTDRCCVVRRYKGQHTNRGCNCLSNPDWLGLTDKTAHGLRKYRLTTIAEAGGSAHAIMAWGGHKSLDEVAHYTRAAEMKRLISGTEQKQNGVSRRP